MEVADLAVVQVEGIKEEVVLLQSFPSQRPVAVVVGVLVAVVVAVEGGTVVVLRMRRV